MAAKIQIFSTSEQAQLLTMRSHDLWHDGKIIRCKTIFHRALFWLQSLFSGENRKSFEVFYARIKENIRVLTSDLDKGEQVFLQIQTILKIQGKVANTGWIRGLEIKDPVYREFRREVEQLRQKAESRVDDWASQDIENRREVARWIHAKPMQRRFAASLGLQEVPYQFSEIPRGAVILTDPRLYLKSTQLKRHGSIAKTLLLHFKAVICWMATGKRYTHAELSLGKGEAFDLDKKQGKWVRGEMRIQSRGNSTCYGAILAANEPKMLQAHQRAYRERGMVPFGTFEELWSAIDREARASVPLIQATIMDLVRVALRGRRPADYDAMGAWQPGVKSYGCSATTSALFSKFGIDIGRQFNKKDANISPADFLKSEFFQTLYVPD